MNPSEDQSVIKQHLEDVKIAVLNRLDQMEAKLSAEFQKLASPTPAESVTPTEER